MERSRLLIIDDDERLCRLMRDFLVPLGFSVETAGGGEEGLRMLQEQGFDLVILDVMMPKMDGFEVLKHIRNTSDIPVLMLTARSADMDRITGLEGGADDYLPKTASTRELVARIRAIGRRYQQGSRPSLPDIEELISIGPLTVNPQARTAYVRDKRLDLTPNEFLLLHALAKHQGRTLSRNHLGEIISGRDYNIFDRSVDVHISNLRGKLEDDPKKPRFIRTVRGAGYILDDHEPKRMP